MTAPDVPEMQDESMNLLTRKLQSESRGSEGPADGLGPASRRWPSWLALHLGYLLYVALLPYANTLSKDGAEHFPYSITFTMVVETVLCVAMAVVCALIFYKREDVIDDSSESAEDKSDRLIATAVDGLCGHTGDAAGGDALCVRSNHSEDDILVVEGPPDEEIAPLYTGHARGKRWRSNKPPRRKCGPILRAIFHPCQFCVWYVPNMFCLPGQGLLRLSLAYISGATKAALGESKLLMTAALAWVFLRMVRKKAGTHYKKMRERHRMTGGGSGLC